MNKQNFDELAESIVEAGMIKRGLKKPAREFSYRIKKAGFEKISTKIWAICIETDDEELLTPRKIYEIELIGERVLVTDEKGEPTFYPQEFFAPISLPAELRNTLLKTI